MKKWKWMVLSFVALAGLALVSGCQSVVANNHLTLNDYADHLVACGLPVEQIQPVNPGPVKAVDAMSVKFTDNPNEIGVYRYDREREADRTPPGSDRQRRVPVCRRLQISGIGSGFFRHHRLREECAEKPDSSPPPKVFDEGTPFIVRNRPRLLSASGVAGSWSDVWSDWTSWTESSSSMTGAAKHTRRSSTSCAPSPGVTVLTHPVNQGKGAAVKTAFRHILAHAPATGAVTIDADGTTPSGGYPPVVRCLPGRAAIALARGPRLPRPARDDAVAQPFRQPGDGGDLSFSDRLPGSGYPDRAALLPGGIAPRGAQHRSQPLRVRTGNPVARTAMRGAAGAIADRGRCTSPTIRPRISAGSGIRSGSTRHCCVSPGRRRGASYHAADNSFAGFLDQTENLAV